MVEYNSLEEVAKKIRSLDRKIIVLYAFNGTGKTRLSVKFKELVNEVKDEEIIKHLIYYNAYTEDLFFWDNDLKNNNEKKLKINKNSAFIDLIESQGKENEVAKKFKEFTFSKIEPNINTKTGEVTFSLPTGDGKSIENIKISRGEENVFIWTMFYVLLETIISELNIDEESERSTNEFDNIKYIYIDDPVSSLDDNHIIELAINLKKLIAGSKNEDLKFIISTHHALFYNVLFNETNMKNEYGKKKNGHYILKKNEDRNIYLLEEIKDSIFGYHLKVKQEIQNAIDEDRIEKYHFALFRNLLEKTANFLGYKNWGSLIQSENITADIRESYIRRINLYSHNKFSDLEYKELQPEEKNMLKLLFNNFKKEFKWEE